MFEFTCNTKDFLRVIKDERRLLEILLVLKLKKRQNEVTSVTISELLISELSELYLHLFTTFKIQKIFKCVINFPQFLIRNSHFNIVLASKEVPFGYRMSLKGIKRFETYAHLAFSAGTYFISDIPCNRNTKRMVDYFADTTCFITLN